MQGAKVDVPAAGGSSRIHMHSYPKVHCVYALRIHMHSYPKVLCVYARRKRRQRRHIFSSLQYNAGTETEIQKRLNRLKKIPPVSIVHSRVCVLNSCPPSPPSILFFFERLQYSEVPHQSSLHGIQPTGTWRLRGATACRNSVPPVFKHALVNKLMGGAPPLLHQPPPPLLSSVSSYLLLYADSRAIAFDDATVVATTGELLCWNHASSQLFECQSLHNSKITFCQWSSSGESLKAVLVLVTCCSLSDWCMLKLYAERCVCVCVCVQHAVNVVRCTLYVILTTTRYLEYRLFVCCAHCVW